MGSTWMHGTLDKERVLQNPSSIRIVLFQAAWFLGVWHGRAQPQRDMCRLHRLLHDVEQLLTQLAQVYLIA